MQYDAPYSDSLDTYCRLNEIIDVFIYGDINGALVNNQCIDQEIMDAIMTHFIHCVNI